MSRYLSSIGYAALLVIPTWDTLLKYTGWPGVVAYSILGAAVFVGLEHIGWAKLLLRLDERGAEFALAAILVAFVAIIAVVYPIANSGRFGGGSDVDDALILGAARMLHGLYPYTEPTYLGGWISNLPGS